MIPVGARLDDVYWALPTTYSPGDRFESESAAISEGIARKRTQLARPDSEFIPESFTVDLRWTLSWESAARNPASGTDIVAARHTYKTLAEAEEHLARIRKFTPEETR